MTSRIRFQSKAEARFTGALWISTAAWRPDARNFSQQKNFQPFLKLCFWRLLLILPHKVTQTPDMRQLQGEPSSKPQIFIQRRRVPKGVPMRLCQPILPAALRANRTPAMIVKLILSVGRCAVQAGNTGAGSCWTRARLWVITQNSFQTRSGKQLTSSPHQPSPPCALRYCMAAAWSSSRDGPSQSTVPRLVSRSNWSVISSTSRFRRILLDIAPETFPRPSNKTNRRVIIARRPRNDRLTRAKPPTSKFGVSFKLGTPFSQTFVPNILSTQRHRRGIQF